MFTGMLKKVSRAGIGVSVEADGLRMAESHGGRVLRCASKAYPPGVSPTSDGFPAFLRQSLTGFSSQLRRVPVWAVGCLPSLQVRYLSLPVPQQKSTGDMVYWTFRKDLPFDAAQTLFDYEVECESGSGVEAKTHVTAYTALREETDSVAALFAKAGISLAGLVIPAFAMRGVLQADTAGRSGVRLCLFAADDASTVIIVSAGQVQSSRVFKTGMNAILGAVRDRDPACTSVEAYRKVKAAFGADSVDDAATAGIREVFERLIQQIERTLGAYLSEHPDAVVQGLHVMGALAGLDTLVQEMGERLGIEVLPVLASERTDGQWTDDDVRGLTAMAAGASLSRLDKTPNLLCNYLRREQIARRSWLSVLMVLLLGLVAALLHLGRGVLEHGNLKLSRRLEVEQTRLNAYSPRVDEPLIQALTSQTVEEGVALKGLSQRWVAPAVLRALEVLTPETVRMTAIEATFSSDPSGSVAEKGKARSRSRGGANDGVLRLKGLVRGSHDLQRSTLVAYVLRLEASLLFSKAVVSSAAEGEEGGDTVLLFELELYVERAVAGDVPVPPPVPVKEAKP
jgi:hypothetical protein